MNETVTAYLAMLGGAMLWWGVLCQAVFHIRRATAYRRKLAQTHLLGLLYILTIKSNGKFDSRRLDHPNDLDRYLQDAQAWFWVFLGTTVSWSVLCTIALKSVLGGD